MIKVENVSKDYELADGTKVTALKNVSFEVKEGENSTIIELTVAPEDMGKVIGRQGRIAKEIRTIIKSGAQRDGQKVSVEIVD
mgnify:CR=1 FL=1